MSNEISIFTRKPQNIRAANFRIRSVTDLDVVIVGDEFDIDHHPYLDRSKQNQRVSTSNHHAPITNGSFKIFIIEKKQFPHEA